MTLLFALTLLADGFVTDDDGRPLAGVSVETPVVPPRSFPRTGAEGRFDIPRGPAVLRKPGYRSVIIRPDGSGGVRVRMRKSSRRIPGCTASARCVHNGGLDGVLCFPPVEGITPGPLQPGIDSVGRTFFASTGEGPLSPDTPRLDVESGYAGSGPSLGPGGRLWTSTETEESVFTVHGGSKLLKETRAIDSRGRAPDGTYWRYLGAAPESAQYAGVDASTASKFDRLLDSACEQLFR